MARMKKHFGIVRKLLDYADTSVGTVRHAMPPPSTVSRASKPLGDDPMDTSRSNASLASVATVVPSLSGRALPSTPSDRSTTSGQQTRQGSAATQGQGQGGAPHSHSQSQRHLPSAKQQEQDRQSRQIQQQSPQTVRHIIPVEPGMRSFEMVLCSRLVAPLKNAEHEEEGDEDLMLEGVIVPAINKVGDSSFVLSIVRLAIEGQDWLFKTDIPQLIQRIPNDQARHALNQLKLAFEAAEQEIPGVTSALVLEIVDNVEQVET
jgi:serine/threonine-protein kinase 24/25/MST4